MIKADNLSKSYTGDPLFTDVSFVINDGERVGLVGPNGVGKSTLLKVLAGIELPDGGAVIAGHEQAIGYLPQQAMQPDTSVTQVLENALGEVAVLARELGGLEQEMATSEADLEALLPRYSEAQERFDLLGGWQMDATIDAALEKTGASHLERRSLMRDLSGGEQARTLMAGALTSNPQILLLDEPTNHLDLAGLEWLESYLVAYAGSILVISHDRRFLDRVVHRVFELDGIEDTLQAYEGGYTEYTQEKHRRWERRLLEYEAQEKYRKRLEEDIRRTKTQAVGVETSTRNDVLRRYAKKVAKKAKARERRLERQMKLTAWIAKPETKPKLRLDFSGVSQKGESIISLRNASFAYDSERVLTDIDLSVHGRDRLAIVGANGSGKSSLLHLIEGELTTVTPNRVGLLPQVHTDLPLKQSVLSFFRSQIAMYEDEARTVLDRFLFDQVQLQQPLGLLSPGERARLLLARLVFSGADVLLLDEPTNHLDFDSLDVVEEALRELQGTLIVVSHDRQFLENLRPTEYVVMSQGKILDRYMPHPEEDGPATYRLPARLVTG